MQERSDSSDKVTNPYEKAIHVRMSAHTRHEFTGELNPNGFLCRNTCVSLSICGEFC